MNIDNYNNRIRQVVGKVDMNFYENVNDNDADVSTSFPITDWRNFASSQIISTGLNPKYKYASPDGVTKPDGTYYPYLKQPETIIPLWSTQVCDDNKLFSEDIPIYELNFYNKRRVNSLKIIADTKRNEYPLSYTLSLYTLNDDIEEGAIETPTSEYYAIEFTNPSLTPTTETINGVTYKVYTFCVGGTPIESKVSFNPAEPNSPYQFISFGKNYQVYKIALKILKWSEPHTTAKIMFFSNETKAIFENNQLASIKVLEEKTDNIEELSYGITSNSCTVKVSNENDRFTKNPDLLKKNRIIKPYIKCKENDTWDNLGVFYSDSWEVSSTSKYVTCKCYDILYNLQKMNICYQMRHTGEDISKNYYVEQNKSYFEVFTKVAELINEERINLGIYGADINFKIDERLKNVFMPYVLIGCDTAWNILKELANQSLSYVYVDRQGNICVTRDELGTDRIPEENKKICTTQIDETNSFTYNLPTMSRTIVNRVKVPYLTLEEGEEKNDDIFKIKKQDIFYDEDGFIKIDIELKNFYPNIKEIKRKNSLDLPIEINAKSIKCCYNKIEIILNEQNFEEEVKIEIISNNIFKLTTQSIQKDNILSQKQNGVVEYELDAKNIFGNENANLIAKNIITEYSNGKSYIETEWRGTSEICLNSFAFSRNDKQKELTRYEIVSNELTLENGLRFTTKARQN